MTCDVGNPGPGLGQAQKGDGFFFFMYVICMYSCILVSITIFMMFVYFDNNTTGVISGARTTHLFRVYLQFLVRVVLHNCSGLTTIFFSSFCPVFSLSNAHILYYQRGVFSKFCRNLDQYIDMNASTDTFQFTT